jgi:hypothetical protein
MNRPHCCPICNDLRIRTTLESYTVTAHVSGDDRAVNALAAFTCDRGHIFFVLSTDLVAEPLPRTNRQSA